MVARFSKNVLKQMFHIFSVVSKKRDVVFTFFVEINCVFHILFSNFHVFSSGRAAAGYGAAPAAHSTGHGRLPPADAARPAPEGRSTDTVVGASAVYSTTRSNKKGLHTL